MNAFSKTLPALVIAFFFSLPTIVSCSKDETSSKSDSFEKVNLIIDG